MKYKSIWESHLNVIETNDFGTGINHRPTTLQQCGQEIILTIINTPWQMALPTRIN